MTEAAEQHEPEMPPEEQPDAEAIARALNVLLEEKEKEVAALKDQSLRALAEVENIRRRAERDQADTAKYAVSKFAGDLVGVLENLQRAVDAISPELRKEQPAVGNLAIGVEMTLKELLGAFEKHGIKRLDPLGQKFDHNFHQAVTQVEDGKAEAGTILQVLQAGYIIHDRLLRPAMVVVATNNNSATLNTSV
ncbi:MAG: nucleotide exchange factor GrpE [Alphaproteobacteria bacterium]|nr:nucleotide exchange factor GrpE [Alphaproteobacteria bacterium]